MCETSYDAMFGTKVIGLVPESNLKNVSHYSRNEFIKQSVVEAAFRAVAFIVVLVRVCRGKKEGKLL